LHRPRSAIQKNRKHGTSALHRSIRGAVSRWLLKRSCYYGSVWSHFGLATNNNALDTFSFLMLLYFAVFSIVSARETPLVLATLPSNTFFYVCPRKPDALTGHHPDVRRSPGTFAIALVADARDICLCHGCVASAVNDAVKVGNDKNGRFLTPWQEARSM